MMIEDVTVQALREAVEKSTDSELKDIRYRFICMYRKYFEGSQDSVAVIKAMGEETELTRRDFFRKYAILVKEIRGRGVRMKETSLDREAFKKALRGIDPAALEDYKITDGAVSITGDFLKSAAAAEVVMVSANVPEGLRTGEVAAWIEKAIEGETGKAVMLEFSDAAPAGDHMPIFDIILAKRGDIGKRGPEADPEVEHICKYCDAPARWAYTWNDGREFIPVCHKHRIKARGEFLKARAPECMVRKIDDVKPGAQVRTEIRKPYPSEHSARLQDPHQFDIFRRTRGGKVWGVDVPKTIGVIWAKTKAGKIQPQALRFPKDKWTAAEARAWLKENEVKYQNFEPAAKVAKQAAPEPDEAAKETALVFIRDHWETFTDYERRLAGSGDQAGKLFGRVDLPGEAIEVWASPHYMYSMPGYDDKWLVELRFPADTWPESRVRDWAEENHVEPIHVEPARTDDFKKAEFKILKTDEDRRLVGGIVYEPMATDTQGDYTTAEEIDKALVKFMERYASGGGKLKVMHKGRAFNFPVIECFQPDEDIQKGGQKIKAGAWWLMIKINSDKVWGAIKAGDLTGFSMGGSAAVG